MIRSLSCAIMAATLTLVLVAPALAHKVSISAYAEAGVIHTESSFSSKQPVPQGTMEVRNAGSNELLLTGTSDDEGKWSFSVPQDLREKRPDLLLTIKAGQGHQGQLRVPAAKYLEVVPTPSTQ